MRKRIRIFLLILLGLFLVAGVIIYSLSRPDTARFSVAEVSGRVPVLATQKPEIFPTIRLPKAKGWPSNGAPRAARGLTVSRFTEGLEHPRSLLVLPNGDILVAESDSQARKNSGIEGAIVNHLMKRAGSPGKSPDRITLLRDGDGDGKAEVKAAYITGLTSPYGMALVGDILYVANTDALLAFRYEAGELKMSSTAEKIISLPAGGTNSHWTKSLIASPDGKSLFIGVGADSNIGETGMERELNRAAILEVRLEQAKQENDQQPDSADLLVPLAAVPAERIYAAGLRNPVGLAIHPDTGDLWTVVNERDLLGSDLVPDYLTRIDLGDFYGWPWYYWGGFIDSRVPAPARDRRQYVRRPDYALGAHVAPLGLSFATGQKLGESWDNGVFIALHGSWNRDPVSGYSVIFVKFNAKGKPVDALPVTLLDAFLDDDEDIARGRPADVRIAKDGALLVADDVGGIIWRVTKAPKP